MCERLRWSATSKTNNLLILSLIHREGYTRCVAKLVPDILAARLGHDPQLLSANLSQVFPPANALLVQDPRLLMEGNLLRPLSPRIFPILGLRDSSLQQASVVKHLGYRLRDNLLGLRRDNFIAIGVLRRQRLVRRQRPTVSVANGRPLGLLQQSRRHPLCETLRCDNGDSVPCSRGMLMDSFIKFKPRFIANKLVTGRATGTNSAPTAPAVFLFARNVILPFAHIATKAPKAAHK